MGKSKIKQYTFSVVCDLLGLLGGPSSSRGIPGVRGSLRRLTGIGPSMKTRVLLATSSLVPEKVKINIYL